MYAITETTYPNQDTTVLDVEHVDNLPPETGGLMVHERGGQRFEDWAEAYVAAAGIAKYESGAELRPYTATCISAEAVLRAGNTQDQYYCVNKTPDDPLMSGPWAHDRLGRRYAYGLYRDEDGDLAWCRVAIDARGRSYSWQASTPAEDDWLAPREIVDALDDAAMV